MRRYETILIADVNLPNDEYKTLVERYKKIIADSKGIIVKIEDWGKRKLAYEINKQSRGSYVLIDFVSKSAVITELERNLKIDDKILKFLTVKKSESVDMQKIEEEIAAAQAAEVSEEPESLPIIKNADAGNATEGNALVEEPKQDQAEAPAEASEGKEEEKGENL